MSRVLMAILAICEAVNTASGTTIPRNAGHRNSQYLGPIELDIERAGTTGGGTIYGVNLNGENNANRMNIVGDGIATTFQTTIAYAALSNYNWIVRADLLGRTGTVTVTVGSKTVTGSSTAFTTEVQVGDVIAIGDQRRKVESITSDTVLTVDENYLVAAAAAVVSVVNGIMVDTTDFAVTNVGGYALITISAAARLASGVKADIHFVTPVALFTFATATVQFKKVQVQGMELLWYAAGSTTAPSATNIYARPLAA